jgi:hypothetical protein
MRKRTGRSVRAVLDTPSGSTFEAFIGVPNGIAWRGSKSRFTVRRRRADAAVDEVRKAMWLTFAEEWMKLADEAEQAGLGHPRRPPGHLARDLPS